MVIKPYTIRQKYIVIRRRKYKIWRLEDINENVIAKGRKKEVGGKAYFRYVYQHIFTDLMYPTNEWL